MSPRLPTRGPHVGLRWEVLGARWPGIGVPGFGLEVSLPWSPFSRLARGEGAGHRAGAGRAGWWPLSPAEPRPPPPGDPQGLADHQQHQPDEGRLQGVYWFVLTAESLSWYKDEEVSGWQGWDGWAMVGRALHTSLLWVALPQLTARSGKAP